MKILLNVMELVMGMKVVKLGKNTVDVWWTEKVKGTVRKKTPERNVQ